jgi:hypothetical protein
MASPWEQKRPVAPHVYAVEVKKAETKESPLEIRSPNFETRN